MDKKLIPAEVLVGIFVLLCLVILGYMTMKVGKVSLRTQEGYDLTVIFENISGLVRDSPIEIAGVEVGRVKEISLSENKARVVLRIRPLIYVPKDSKAIIRTKGILGDKYVEIKPGKSSETLEPNSTITEVITPMDLDLMVSKLTTIMDEIQTITNSLSKAMGSEEGSFMIEETIGNVRDISHLVMQFLVNQGPSLGETLSNIKEVSETFNTIAKNIEKGEGTIGKLMTDTSLYNDLRGAVDSLNSFASDMKESRGTLGKLVKDDALYEQLNGIVAKLNNVAEKINKGEGTLGKLVNDETLYDEAKNALRNVNNASEGIQEQIPISVLGTIGGTVLR